MNPAEARILTNQIAIMASIRSLARITIALIPPEARSADIVGSFDDLLGTAIENTKTAINKACQAA